jgi:hypothetical protein
VSKYTLFRKKLHDSSLPEYTYLETLVCREIPEIEQRSPYKDYDFWHFMMLCTFGNNSGDETGQLALFKVLVFAERYYKDQICLSEQSDTFLAEERT